MDPMVAHIDARALREVLYSPLVDGTHSEITGRFAALSITDADEGMQGTKAQTGEFGSGRVV